MALSPAATTTTITGGTYFLNGLEHTKNGFSCLNISFSNFFFLSFFFYWFFLLIWLLFFTSRRKKVSKSKRLRIFETLWSHSSRAWLFNFFFPSAVSGLVVCSSEIWLVLPKRKKDVFLLLPDFLRCWWVSILHSRTLSGSQSLSLCPIQKLYIRHCC